MAVVQIKPKAAEQAKPVRSAVVIPFRGKRHKVESFWIGDEDITREFRVAGFTRRNTWMAAKAAHRVSA